MAFFTWISKYNDFLQLGHQKIATHILTHQLKIGETVRQQPTVAKLNYINLWEHIEESGRAYFQVAFKKDQLKKEEFVALSSEKIMRLDTSGKIIQSWWLQTLRFLLRYLKQLRKTNFKGMENKLGC